MRSEREKKRERGKERAGALHKSLTLDAKADLSHKSCQIMAHTPDGARGLGSHGGRAR